MPALFSLGIHGALEAAQLELQEGEQLYAYLDDIYAITRPERSRAVFDIVRRHLAREAGIHVNLGKCRAWNRSGREPTGMQALGSDVWVGGRETPIHMRGLM
eukprot:1608801-Karenia_brevis.AAC.1